MRAVACCRSHGPKSQAPISHKKKKIRFARVPLPLRGQQEREREREMSSEKKKSSASSSKASDYLVNLVWVGAVSYLISQFLKNAYIIRMQAIEEFGPVIHEFDPYFNWRATQVYTICCVLVICNTIHWSQFIINVTKILISLLITATHPTPPHHPTVPLRKWIQKVLHLVRPQGMVSPRPSRRHDHFPGDAIHCRLS